MHRHAATGLVFAIDIRQRLPLGVPGAKAFSGAAAVISVELEHETVEHSFFFRLLLSTDLRGPREVLVAP